MRQLLFCIFLLIAAPAAADQKLTCGGAVAPGLAYPDANGQWAGLEVDLCRKLGTEIGASAIFTPILQDTDTPPASASRSAIFLPERDIPAGYIAGPVIYNDTQAIMVPASSKARSARNLAGEEICVEPGSPEDFNLVDYFTAHKIPLREFVFQETDEMRDAYTAGRCDAITARKSLLIGLRANEDGARRDDIILPDNLGDNPFRVATPAGQPGWTALVAQTIEENSHAP
jgi:general L-amino acid transport system substrate-binding protein